ncbi:MAG: TIGR03668 family PPOX class F420-dependent oxidoreductase [Nitrospinae bacterium]|nr:TIGR03668 family PPOX class F420-dependent oxidoreductase [Nitrospinota bacterium]
MTKPLLSGDAWAFVERARVARLATAGRDAAPHVVPVVFAVLDGKIYVPVDGKQKNDIERLKRLDNIRENAQVSFLVDHYEDDWAKLGFVLIFGSARIIHAEADAAAYEKAAAHLRQKYAQYRGSITIHAWMIEITPHRAASWGAMNTEEL